MLSGSACRLLVLALVLAVFLRNAVSYSVFNGSVNAWEPNFAPKQHSSLAYVLMTFVDQLYSFGL